MEPKLHIFIRDEDGDLHDHYGSAVDIMNVGSGNMRTVKVFTGQRNPDGSPVTIDYPNGSIESVFIR